MRCVLISFLRVRLTMLSMPEYKTADLYQFTHGKNPNYVAIALLLRHGVKIDEPLVVLPGFDDLSFTWPISSDNDIILGLINELCVDQISNLKQETKEQFLTKSEMISQSTKEEVQDIIDRINDPKLMIQEMMKAKHIDDVLLMISLGNVPINAKFTFADGHSRYVTDWFSKALLLQIKEALIETEHYHENIQARLDRLEDQKLKQIASIKDDLEKLFNDQALVQKITSYLSEEKKDNTLENILHHIQKMLQNTDFCGSASETEKFWALFNAMVDFKFDHYRIEHAADLMHHLAKNYGSAFCKKQSLRLPEHKRYMNNSLFLAAMTSLFHYNSNEEDIHKILKSLVDANTVDFNSNDSDWGNTILLTFISNGDFNRANLFIKIVNDLIKPEKLNLDILSTYFGTGLLHLAIAKGYEKLDNMNKLTGMSAVALVEVLLDNGANPNVEIAFLRQEAGELNNKFNQLTPLHLACARRDIAMITLLLKHGAKLDAQDIHHRTPLAILSLPFEERVEIISMASGGEGLTDFHEEKDDFRGLKETELSEEKFAMVASLLENPEKSMNKNVELENLLDSSIASESSQDPRQNPVLVSNFNSIEERKRKMENSSSSSGTRKKSRK